MFADVREATVLAGALKNDYNHVQPHSSLSYFPPAVIAANLERGDAARLPSMSFLCLLRDLQAQERCDGRYNPTDSYSEWCRNVGASH